jgi:hypothetical protein
MTAPNFEARDAVALRAALYVDHQRVYPTAGDEAHDQNAECGCGAKWGTCQVRALLDRLAADEIGRVLSGRRELRVYGASDDLVELEGAISDEYNTPAGGLELVLTAPDGSALVVTALYTKAGGTWAIGVAPAEEGEDLPDWIRTVRTSPSCGYSAELVLDVPEGTIVKSTERRR